MAQDRTMPQPPQPRAITPKGPQASSRSPTEDLEDLPAQDCGCFDIRIGADGTWFYRGSPINRPEMVRLFASTLKRDAAGQYWLETPYERGRIVVEDMPFTVVEVDAEGEGREQKLWFRTNLGESVPLDGAHPLKVTEGPSKGELRPYIVLDHGLEARLVRAAYYQLIDKGEERETPTPGVSAPGQGSPPSVASPSEESRETQTVFGIWSNGIFFTLAVLEPEPASSGRPG